MSMPPGWARAPLGEIVDVTRGRLSPQKHPDMPFVGMDNVEAHTMRLVGTVPARTMKSSAVHFLRGDVLYGRLRPYLNKVVQPDFDGLASAEFIPLTPHAGVLPEFIRLRLNSADFVAFASRLDEGDRPRVDWDGIRQFEVLLPPSAEQARIVETVESMLSCLDAAVANLKSAQRKLKAYRASVLKAAVEGRLVPAEAELARKKSRKYESADVLLERVFKERLGRWKESEPAQMKAAGRKPKDERWKTKYEQFALDQRELPPLPEGWRWARLDQVSDVQLGQQRAPVHAEASEHLPYVRAANITWDGLDLSDVKTMGFPNQARYRLAFGDVLLSEASGSPMEAGKPAVWRDEVPGACYQKTLLRVRPFDLDSLLPEFVRLVFLRDCISGKFARLAPGVGIVHLTAERMLPWPVPVPPRDEQRRIVDEADRLETVHNSIRATLTRESVRLRRLRQAVLTWAFEGRLVDQQPGEEPADALLTRLRSKRAEASPARPLSKRARRLRAGS